MNYLTSVSIRPAATMRAILDHPKRPPAIPVVIAAIVSWSLRDLDLQSLSEAASSLGLAASILLTVAVVAGTVLFALLFYFVVAAAATAAGRWMLGGTGTWRDVRHALAWGLAPQVWALFFRIPALLIWPDAVAMLRGGREQIRIGEITLTPFLGQVPLYQTLMIFSVELAFLIWYLVVGSQTLAVAQGFSSLRGLGNLVLAVILPFVALMILAAAFVLTTWSAG